MPHRGHDRPALRDSQLQDVRPALRDDSGAPHHHRFHQHPVGHGDRGLQAEGEGPGEHRGPPRVPGQGDQAGRGGEAEEGRAEVRGLLHLPGAGHRHRVRGPGGPDRVAEVGGQGPPAHRAERARSRAYVQGPHAGVREGRPGGVRGAVPGRSPQAHRPRGHLRELPRRALPEPRGNVPGAEVGRGQGVGGGATFVLLPQPPQAAVPGGAEVPG
ncbi:MAG: hypothetical protein A4E31_00115 [Methanomassiliicoccales archaeon PtaU1.Bin030]|nr:MAG: hypothetical protein A4E31_00115 [Methanomassiliicoccales archaeon PtaU1.Bin030]